MGSPKSKLRVVEAFDPYVVHDQRKIEVAPSIRRLTPYEVVESEGSIGALRGGSNIFKLDWNEATIPPSPKARQAIQEFVVNNGGLNWYPNLGSRTLVNALADYTNVPADQILVTAGSDSALQLICDTFLDVDDEVVVPVPTYNHFLVFAQSRGVRLISVLARDPFTPDVSALRSALSQSTRLVYLVSPNNPTGVVYDAPTVEALCAEYPNTLFVVDEAYFEFSQITAIESVSNYPNLLVTRTFSKAFGLAGLRIGYLAGHPSLIEGLNRIYNPKSVNTLAQIGALEALEDQEYLNGFLDEVKRSRRLLVEFFEGRKLEVFNTPANFIVIRFPEVTKTIERLAKAGIFVRDRSNYPGLADCIRMSVGNVQQTKELIRVLSDVI